MGNKVTTIVRTDAEGNYLSNDLIIGDSDPVSTTEERARDLLRCAKPAATYTTDSGDICHVYKF